jgi:hypothetical protein
MDRSVPSVRERWEAGAQHAPPLWEAIRAQGFPRWAHALRRSLRSVASRAGAPRPPTEGAEAFAHGIPRSPPRHLRPKAARARLQSASRTVSPSQQMLRLAVSALPRAAAQAPPPDRVHGPGAGAGSVRLRPLVVGSRPDGLAGGAGRWGGAGGARMPRGSERGSRRGGKRVVAGQVTRIKTLKGHLSGRATLSVLQHQVLL